MLLSVDVKVVISKTMLAIQSDIKQCHYLLCCYLSVYLSICLSVCLSIYLSVYLSVMWNFQCYGLQRVTPRSNTKIRIYVNVLVRQFFLKIRLYYAQKILYNDIYIQYNTMQDNVRVIMGSSSAYVLILSTILLCKQCILIL